MARKRFLTRLVKGGNRSSLFAWPRYAVSTTPCSRYTQLTFKKLVEERVLCGKLRHVDIPHYANTSSSALTTQADCFVGDGKESILPVPALFAFDRRYTHRPDFLLRTILAQFCLFQTIPSEIETEYKRHADASEIRKIFELTCSVIKQLDDDALKLHGCDLTDGIKLLSLTLIVDALDEVPAREQLLVVQMLDQLSALNSKQRRVRIRIIMFVRTDSSVHLRCRKSHPWDVHHISKETVDVDIHTAVLVRLKSQPSLQGMSLAELDRVVSTILTRVDGM
jgi:hypothetical protein